MTTGFKRAANRPGPRPSAGNKPSRGKTLAGVPKLFRAIWHPDFMRYGRPDDYGELRERRKYMLDTDICLYIGEERSERAMARLAKTEEGEAVISAITLAELRYGAHTIHGDKRRKIALGGLEKMLDLVPVVPFDEDAAMAYAQVRAVDPKRNIRAMDKLIAAHAVALGLVLVTNNPKDFRKFRPALRVENWAAGKR